MHLWIFDSVKNDHQLLCQCRLFQPARVRSTTPRSGWYTSVRSQCQQRFKNMQQIKQLCTFLRSSFHCHCELLRLLTEFPNCQLSCFLWTQFLTALCQWACLWELYSWHLNLYCLISMAVDMDLNIQTIFYWIRSRGSSVEKKNNNKQQQQTEEVSHHWFLNMCLEHTYAYYLKTLSCPFLSLWQDKQPFMFSSDEVGGRQVQIGVLHLLELIPRNVLRGIEGYLQEMKERSLTSVHSHLLLWPLQWKEVLLRQGDKPMKKHASCLLPYEVVIPL